MNSDDFSVCRFKVLSQGPLLNREMFTCRDKQMRLSIKKEAGSKVHGRRRRRFLNKEVFHVRNFRKIFGQSPSGCCGYRSAVTYRFGIGPVYPAVLAELRIDHNIQKSALS